VCSNWVSVAALVVSVARGKQLSVGMLSFFRVVFLVDLHKGRSDKEGIVIVFGFLAY